MKIARILVLAVASMAALASCKKDVPGGEPAVKYDVKCAEVKNGKISASAAQAEAGTVITLTATADQGCEFGAWSVVNASTGDAVAVTDNKFTMPAANVNVSATFFKEGTLKTIDEIFAAAEKAGKTETEVTVSFNSYVVTGTATNNKNAYVTDGTKGFIVYAENHGFEAGDVISGVADCKVQLYKGAAELTELTSVTEGITVSKGGQVAPAKIAIADLSGVNTGALVAFESLSYNGAVFTDGTNTITPYGTFITLPAFLKGKKYEVTGVYIQFDNTKEIAPRTENDIKPVAMPEYDVNIAKDIANGKVEVNFSKATEGQEVTISTFPNEGYKLKAGSISVTKASSGAVSVTNNKFTMPAEAVTVSAEFEEQGEPVPTTDVEFDFTAIKGFDSWTSYAEHVVEYDEATVTFASACKQATTIDNMPVTKGGDVSAVMKNSEETINSLTFTCKQWTTKTQTITLHTSTDSGANWSDTGITSDSFELVADTLPVGVNAVKFTFNSNKNQVGIASLKLNYNKR